MMPWNLASTSYAKMLLEVEVICSDWHGKPKKFAKNSPIYGWPLSLVEKSLRCLSSDGALARKEFDWPFPLTEKFYHKLSRSWRNWRAFGTSMWLP